MAIIAVTVVLSGVVIAIGLWFVLLRGQYVGSVRGRHQGTLAIPSRARVRVRRFVTDGRAVSGVHVQLWSVVTIKTLELKAQEARSMAAVIEQAVERVRKP